MNDGTRDEEAALEATELTRSMGYENTNGPATGDERAQFWCRIAGIALQRAHVAETELKAVRLVDGVMAASKEEETKATLEHVREQRDALLLACTATKLFHSVGGLVTLDQLQAWSALTSGCDFSAQGLFDFVTEQMSKAGCK